MVTCLMLMMMMMMMMMVAIVKLWFLCHNQKLSRAVIKRWGLGISPGYFDGKIEEKWNQKKSLAV